MPQRPTPPKDLMSVSEFIEAYSIPRTTFYDQVRVGKIKVRKLGRRTLITRIDAEAWLNALEVKPV